MTTDISWFGTLILCAALLSASGSIAAAMVATKGVSAPLTVARRLFYAAFFFISSAAFLLAYAFQIGDYSLRYVAQYSDRAMSWPYLFAALWAGQDGSLLWWTFTLGALSVLCLWRVRGKATLLEPYVVAVLATIVGFFILVMLFAADPFTKTIGPALFDGQGLNPLLRNPWMLVHPPVLYLGMVGWALPFAFAVAALFSGQLSNQWLMLARPWVLLAWGALAMGNILGMVWSYEVLGWGGYWAWDPVENASFLPMLSATAYLHSAIAQERRESFKGWSVALLCLTFFMIVFGTFLTRSGLIASVHAFSRSGMTGYFVGFMTLIAALCLGLIAVRRRELHSTLAFEKLQGRAFVFWLINLLMISMLVFVSASTLFPLVSEAVRGETVTVGASFYNRWMAPLGLVLIFLLGLGPLIPWRAKGLGGSRREFILPALVGAAAAIVHLAFGASVGYPAIVPLGQEASDRANLLTDVMARGYALIPLLVFTLSAFATTAYLQALIKVATGSASANSRFNLHNWVRALARARRFTGATTVHLGVILMCVGFTGSLYDRESQAALRPGETITAGAYQVRFDQPRMEPGFTKRVLLADLTVLHQGRALGRLVPGKYFYNKPPGTTTTEVAIRTSLTEDIYVILNSVNPSNRVGTFRVIVRPLVVWIWIGSLLILLGTLLCLSVRRSHLAVGDQRSDHSSGADALS